MKKRQILLGVTGGIAAYKIPLLVREFIKRGAVVRALMTESAREFVTPLTLSTLTGSDVIVGTFPSGGSGHATGTWHIDLARWGDMMIIAPATANVIARLAHGNADDAVSTLALAYRKDILVCPAMDHDMWDHPATQANVSALRDTGYLILPPDEGELASGLTGPGRLPEILSIADTAEGILDGSRLDMKGMKLLVSAGPTHEAIDPVRYIGNRSSGKMGFAIASAAARRGADVTLVAGPVHLKTPRGVERIDVESAAEMESAVMRRRRGADGIVMAAAVADFTPVTVSSRKIKKSASGDDGTLDLRLKKTPDILKSLTAATPRPPVVGFALETHDEARNAAKKLKEKGADILVLNNPLRKGSEFGGETNSVTFLFRNGKREKMRVLPKFAVANALLDRLLRLMAKNKPSAGGKSPRARRARR
jgi:phosphopantothenoylcysteine decarboxylase/phosphopantothenate--cysteine ligase